MKFLEETRDVPTFGEIDFEYVNSIVWSDAQMSKFLNRLSDAGIGSGPKNLYSEKDGRYRITSKHATLSMLKGIYSGKDLTHRNGYKERLKHIDQIRSGKPVYALMCRAIDPEAQPRDIQSFNKSDVFVGGKLIEEEEEIIRLELVDRITINSFKERYKES